MRHAPECINAGYNDHFGCPCDCHGAMTAPTPPPAASLTAESEALLDEMFGPIGQPNAYFRPSEWCEEASNVRLQLERIEQAAAEAARAEAGRLRSLLRDVWSYCSSDIAAYGGRELAAEVEAAVPAAEPEPVSSMTHEESDEYLEKEQEALDILIGAL